MERIAQHNNTQAHLRLERANRRVKSARRQKRHQGRAFLLTEEEAGMTLANPGGLDDLFTAEEVAQIIGDLRAEGIEVPAGCCPHGDAA